MSGTDSESGTERETLELPNGDVVSPEDVFLFNDYPYRYVPLDHEDYEFKLAPLYWGDSDMDVPFSGPEDLRAQWSAQSRGLLTDDEWEEWLAVARRDDRYGEEELAVIADELPVDDGGGIVASIRRALGL